MAPKYTNAENQQRHRQRLIEQIGLEEFKLREKERLRALYLKNKEAKKEILKPPEEPKPEPEPEPVQQLKPIKKRTTPIIKSQLKEQSINIYIRFIKEFYKHYTNNEVNIDIINCIKSLPYNYKTIKADFAFLNNKATFKDVVNRYNSQLKYLHSIISRVYGMTPIVKKLVPYVVDNNIKYQNERANRIIPDEVINVISFDTNDVIDKVEKANLTNNEKLIAYLALLIPTRRFNDYRLVKISKIKPDDKFDKNFNYYYNGSIYIYNTKNKIHDIIEMPDEIYKLIDNNNEYMLGKLYQQSTLTKNLASILFKIYNMKINNKLLRILYSTYLRSLNLNGIEWDKQAKMMGHSLSENIKYSYVKK
jgi:hypothetical protein